MPRYKDHEKNRLKNARLKKLSLLPKNKKLKRPSDPEQAKEWLRDVADHLSNWPNAGPGYRFVAFAIKRYLRDSKARDLRKELGLIYLPHTVKRGHPKFPIETTVSIIEMLHAGQSPSAISKTLHVQKSRVTLVRTKINKLLGLRQHGARPDGFSIEDARNYAASLPRKELIAMLSATISAKDILPK